MFCKTRATASTIDKTICGRSDPNPTLQQHCPNYLSGITAKLALTRRSYSVVQWNPNENVGEEANSRARLQRRLGYLLHSVLAEGKGLSGGCLCGKESSHYGTVYHSRFDKNYAMKDNKYY